MTSVLKTKLPPKPAYDDVWRYGSRVRRYLDPQGRACVEEIPLRQEDLLFPQEGDRPVITHGHTSDCFYLRSVIERAMESRSGTFVFTEHRIDFGVPGIEPLGPDVVLFDGVVDWDIDRGTLPVAEFAARPLLVIEVTSPDTRKNDLGIKRDLYFRCGVPWYAIVDRRPARGKQVRVLAYRAAAQGYEAVAADKRDRVWLEPIGVWLGAVAGAAVCYDKRGRRIPSLAQAANDAIAGRKKAIAERNKAEKDRTKAVAAKETAEKARSDEEIARKQAEAALRQAERKASDDERERRRLEEETRQLKAELQRLRRAERE